MAILVRQPGAEALAAALESEQRLLISAATMAEALIVADRRNLGEEMERLIQGLGLEVVGVTAASARRAAAAYRRWGKGVHPAALNFGDCLAYDVAKSHGCALLFTGIDFARTDLEAAL